MKRIVVAVETAGGEVTRLTEVSAQDTTDRSVLLEEGAEKYIAKMARLASDAGEEPPNLTWWSPAGRVKRIAILRHIGHVSTITATIRVMVIPEDL